ncbi:MAG: polymerase delta subunit [Actinomycetota bacterium]|nr:DNA polymerase III subunit delta [Actinomycetota bacterium]
MPTYLVSGDDERLISARLSELVNELVGDADRSSVYESYDLAEVQADDRETMVRQVVNAAQTQSLFSDRRVVVVRNVDTTPLDSAPLVDYLRAPADYCHLVFTAKGKVGKALNDAMKKSGTAIFETTPPSKRRELMEWYKTKFIESGLKIDALALEEVADWLGQDSARLPGLIEVLTSTYGPKHRLTFDDVNPFLGQAGSVQPWDLTDAIDSGDTANSLFMMRRMVRSGEYHPFQLMALLHNHYTKAMRLDGSGASDPVRAMQLIGSRSEFQGRKYLELTRAMGPKKIFDAIALLARADRALRGATGLEDELVLEVLVARLSRMMPARQQQRGAKRAGARR